MSCQKNNDKKMEQNEALPRSRQEKKEEKVKPTGFFLDPNGVEFTSCTKKYRYKFTDGTTEYYILSKRGSFFNELCMEKKIEEREEIYGNINFCYLVPSDVIIKQFPNGNIPMVLSRKDIDEINKNDGIVKLESSKKDESGRFVFTETECIKATEEKKKGLREEYLLKIPFNFYSIEEKRKRLREKVTIKATGFFADPSSILKDGDGINRYMFKFANGNMEYYILNKNGVFLNTSSEKEVKNAIMYEKVSDSINSYCLVPPGVVLKQFPNGNIPIKLSQEDINEIKKSNSVVELKSQKEKYGKFIFESEEIIKTIEEKRKQEKEKRFVSVYTDGDLKTKKDIYFKDDEGTKYYLYKVMNDDKVEHININDLVKYDTSVHIYYSTQDGTTKIDCCNGLSLEENSDVYISTSDDISTIKKSNGEVTGATKLEFKKKVRRKKTMPDYKTKQFEEKYKLVNIFTQDEIKKAEEEEKIKMQERKEERKRQEEIAKPTQQKEEESKSKISKTLSAFSGINQKEADNSPLPFKTQGATKDLQR